MTAPVRAALLLLRRFAWMAVLFATATSTARAASHCRLLMSKPLPVKMEGLRPVISAEINGVAAQFFIDTGSFFDFLSPAAATEFKLPLRDAPPWFYVSGVGGSVIPRVATAKSFSVAGMSGKNAQFLVGDNDFGGEEAGLLGQNLFRIADVEFDFADGVLRFVKPQHCGHAVFAYWASPNQFIGEVDLHWTSEDHPELLGKASVNGHDIQVLFDTGSPQTILSLAAAKRAGITPESPGVIPAGESSGVGKRTIKVWSAPVERFEIGGEAIEHTHFLIGQINLSDVGADMLLGSDFFLAHHIYVAYGEDKLYFTYNGGPVFDLNARQAAKAASAPQSPVGNAAADEPQPGAGPASDSPTDAAGFMRRGMAEISRSEFSGAIADLTRACDLAATDADCRYQRGLAYWRSNSPKLALTDFDAALKLSPDDYDAHLARAELQFDRPNAGVEDDLDAVDRLAPQEADLRIHLAALYGSLGQYAADAHQLDVWIRYHPADTRVPRALGMRCWAHAAANTQLDQALADCNQAMHTKLVASYSPLWRLTHQAPPGPGWILRSRSLVYLRMGDFDKAIADDNAALAQIHSDESADPLYLRALAELRKGLKSQGQADLAAARKLQPDIDKDYAGMGLVP